MTHPVLVERQTAGGERRSANKMVQFCFEDYEVRYWTEKWGVLKEQLTEAVQKVGVSLRPWPGCRGSIMSERTGIMDEAGKALSRGNRDDVEPLIRHMKEKPVATGLIILIVGFFLGKIL